MIPARIPCLFPAILLVVVAILAPTELRADTWVDPDWPAMVKEAQMIVLVEIVEGGDFEANVKALKTFKGEAPKNTFTVQGFNGPHLARPDIAKGAFKKGQKWYLFLSKAGATYRTPTPSSENLLLEAGKVMISLHFPTWARYRGLSKTGATYRTPTPSSGNLLLEDGKVRISLHFTTWPAIAEGCGLRTRSTTC
jgi:hypothetical protein